MAVQDWADQGREGAGMDYSGPVRRVERSAEQNSSFDLEDPWKGAPTK